MTIKELENFNTDSAFISCSGLHQSFGMTDVSENTAQIRSTMLNNASRKFLLVDHTKFGRSKTNKISPLSSLDIVFTDSRPSDDWLKKLADNDVGCCFE